MSKQNSRLIINCGSAHISATVFSFDGKQLKIEKSHSVTLDYDSQDDEAWLGAISVGIKEIIRVGKYSGKVNLIIPGNQVLAKTLLLPSVAKNKQAQVLAFEAQYNLPYDLDEIVWDGETISNDGIESEILLGACKSDMANEFCEIILQSGLLINSINASTVLSYSALEASKPDLDDNILLINIGARSSNLFFKNEEGFFVRTINYGGNTLTQFISDSLGKGFSESDDIKLQFFSEEDDLDQESPAFKLMQSCVGNFSRRFAQEVKRSIVMNSRQKNANPVSRIFITGKGAQSKFVRDKITEDLGQNIELFNPLEGIHLPANLAVDSKILKMEMSEVVGEAIKEFNIIDSHTNLNLIPENIRQELKFIGQKPILALAAFLLALFPWFIHSGISKSKDFRDSALMELKQFAQPFEENNAIINENQRKSKLLNQSISQVVGLVETKTNWIQFFADIQESIYDAKDVWIDDLTVVRRNANEDQYYEAYEYSDFDQSEELGDLPEYEVVVKGKMLVRQSASEINQDVLADRIKQIKASFEDSSFVINAKQPKISWKYLSDGLRVLPFEINLIIDTEKPL